MGRYRIDIADPTPEGDAVAAALAQRGFDVARVSCAELVAGTQAELVILAGDAPDATNALRALRSSEDVSLDVPIILVGSLPSLDLDTEAALDLGADAYYRRPAPLERLVRKVETFVAPTATRLPAPLPPTHREPVSQLLRLRSGEVSEIVPVSSPEPAPTKERPPERTRSASAYPTVTHAPESSLPPPPRPPERTMELSADAIADVPAIAELRASAPSREDDISPTLARVLLLADRRIFPASPPLDFRFRATHEPPQMLVPAELLEPAAGLDVDDEALDNFTFVPGARDSFVLPALTPGPPSGSHVQGSASGLVTANAPPEPEGTSAGEPSRPLVEDRGARSVTTGSGSTASPLSSVPVRRSAPPPQVSVRGDSVHPVDPAPFGEPTDRGQGRRGELGEAGLLALVSHVVDRRLDVELTLDLDELGELTLVIVDGALEQAHGPIAKKALAELCATHRLPLAGEPADEGAAQAQLERFVAAGHVTRYDVDAAMTRMAEAMLHAAATARTGRYVLEPLDTAAIEQARAQAPILRVTLLEALVEGMRRRIDPKDLPRLLGPGPYVVSLASDAARRLASLRIEPEVAAFLARHHTGSLDALLAAAHPSIGIAGLTLALSTIGILSLRPGTSKPTDLARVVAAIRDTMGSFGALARDADYFAVLAVPRTATAREIEEAWRMRRAEIERLPIATYALDELEAERTLVLDVLDEARLVLLDTRLAGPYRAALEAS